MLIVSNEWFGGAMFYSKPETNSATKVAQPTRLQMSETTEPIATREPIRALENLGKTMPALAAMVVVLSLVFETSFLLPIGLSFLSYYSWQDFIRNALVWIPGLLLIAVYPIGLSISLMMLKRQNEDIERLDGIIIQLEKELAALGEKVEPKPKFRRRFWFLPTLKDLRDVRFWVFVSCFLGGIYLSTLPHTTFVVFLINFFGVYVLVSEPDGFGDHFGKALATTLLDRRALIGGFLLALLVVCLLGLLDSRLSLQRAETTRIQLRGDQSSAAKQCNVLRALSTVVLAVCDGRVTLISNSFIEFVRYDIEPKK